MIIYCFPLSGFQREQLRDHEERCERIEVELKQPRQPGSSHHNREKEAYLQSEVRLIQVCFNILYILTNDIMYLEYMRWVADRIGQGKKGEHTKMLICNVMFAADIIAHRWAA